MNTFSHMEDMEASEAEEDEASELVFSSRLAIRRFESFKAS